MSRHTGGVMLAAVLLLLPACSAMRSDIFEARQLLALTPDGFDERLYLGSLLSRAGQRDEAEMLLIEALDRAEAATDRAAMGDAQSALGNMYLRQRMPVRAALMHRRALTHYKAVEDPVQVAAAYHNLGLSQARSGHYRASGWSFLYAARQYRSQQQPVVAAMHELNAGVAFLRAGEGRQATAMLRLAEFHLADQGRRLQASAAAYHLGIQARQDGHLRMAAIHFGRALMWSRSGHHAGLAGLAHHGLARITKQRNDLDASRQHFLHAVEAAERMTEQRSLRQVTAVTTAGGRGPAKPLSDRLITFNWWQDEPQVQRFPVRRAHLLGTLHTGLGNLYRQMAHDADAADQYRRAAVLLQEVGLVF